MTSRRRAALVSVLALGTAASMAALAPTSTAAASRAPGGVVAEGLDNPWGLQRAIGHRGMVVAENDGKVTRVFDDGKTKTILEDVGGVAGVAASPTKVFAVIGGASDAPGPQPGGKYGPSRVLRMNYDGSGVKVIANLERYELKHNPDGQKQFNSKGEPLDALSNPFAMTWSKKHGLLVADGGANDVLKVNPSTGKVSTFFVPPTVKDKKPCQSPEANQPGTKGCDPVPTGVQVRDGKVWVSTLGAEVAGAGRIYKLDARGKVQDVIRNLTAPTGVAVRPNGTVFFSQVLKNNPAGPPGRLVRIKDGHRTYAWVPMPIGLLFRGGELYSTAGSLFGPDAGSVVKVPMSAFKEKSAGAPQPN